MEINYAKYPDGLVPAIVQDAKTSKVLMLGFMNEAAVNQTKELGKVTFFSRSKNRLWTKGEESENYLLFKEMKVDCDQDTILIKAVPLDRSVIQVQILVGGEKRMWQFSGSIRKYHPAAENFRR
ncbi:phosphoribosyl-AMP cyclohydrolase [Arachidicoccus ginsenosidivorans]|uniref:phosphoribosyl-AMP cyclohydrolase n=1 Tax=Arachidicoccus ginsenosidivorans TaxID=496057 RepID=UPI001CEF8A56|nr:phosphoribosyl-AMP cyclohydrolase [Arachidicoccus ginsenosidivorans]